MDSFDGRQSSELVSHFPVLVRITIDIIQKAVFQKETHCQLQFLKRYNAIFVVVVSLATCVVV
jgi:hypothetical protein